jgi:hypothetical protein
VPAHKSEPAKGALDQIESAVAQDNAGERRTQATMRPGVIDKLPREKPARFGADHLRAPRAPSPAELNKAETKKALLKPDEPLAVTVERAAEQLNGRGSALIVVA